MKNFDYYNNSGSYCTYRTYECTVLCIVHMSGEGYEFYLTSPDFNPIILANNFSGMIQEIMGQSTFHSIARKNNTISLIITPSFE